MRTWNDLLIYVIETVCGLVITVGIPYLISIIHQKVKNEQLNRVIDRAGDIVKKCVMLVNQTYVDELKDYGAFDEKAQKEAFEKCKQEVLSMLNEESIKAIADTFGDLEQWIRLQIEANVVSEKSYVYPQYSLEDGDYDAE